MSKKYVRWCPFSAYLCLILHLFLSFVSFLLPSSKYFIDHINKVGAQCSTQSLYSFPSFILSAQPFMVYVSSGKDAVPYIAFWHIYNGLPCLSSPVPGLKQCNLLQYKLFVSTFSSTCSLSLPLSPFPTSVSLLSLSLTLLSRSLSSLVLSQYRIQAVFSFHSDLRVDCKSGGGCTRKTMIQGWSLSLSLPYLGRMPFVLLVLPSYRSMAILWMALQSPLVTSDCADACSLQVKWWWLPPLDKYGNTELLSIKSPMFEFFDCDFHRLL